MITFSTNFIAELWGCSKTFHSNVITSIRIIWCHEKLCACTSKLNQEVALKTIMDVYKEHFGKTFKH